MRIPPNLAKYKCFLSGKGNHQYLIFDLTNPINKGLKEELEEEGYWRFAPSRSRYRVSVHQIVLFRRRGRYLPDGYGDLVECHHFDGNTLNNSKDNLIYLTPKEHQLVTRYQRKVTHIDLEEFNNISPLEKSRFNSQGKKLLNHREFMKWVLSKTLITSLRNLRRKIRFDLKAEIAKVLRYVEAIVKRDPLLYPTLEQTLNRGLNKISKTSSKLQAQPPTLRK